jgi:succinoglycan biosynthesis protein ExoV
MKLFYYQGNNFGDKLNPLIWNALAPELLDEDETTVLIGIGTLINSNAPALPKKLVFGAGAGYMSPAKIDDTWKFYCVRGPKTARQLGLKECVAITDPALLLTRICTEPVVRTEEICFMPHHVSSEYADWGAICTKAGITYLDPADDTEFLIRKIRAAKLVIAEAMHGAIVADAFRVPWIPVQCYEHILGFKWEDWCESMSLTYRPEIIPCVWDCDRKFTVRERSIAKLKRGLIRVGIWSDNWTLPLPATNIQKVEGMIVAALSKLAVGNQAVLSDEKVQNVALDRLLFQLEKMKEDNVKAKLVA